MFYRSRHWQKFFEFYRDSFPRATVTPKLHMLKRGSWMLGEIWRLLTTATKSTCHSWYFLEAFRPTGGGLPPTGPNHGPARWTKFSHSTQKHHNPQRWKAIDNEWVASAGTAFNLYFDRICCNPFKSSSHAGGYWDSPVKRKATTNCMLWNTFLKVILYNCLIIMRV